METWAPLMSASRASCAVGPDTCPGVGSENSLLNGQRRPLPSRGGWPWGHRSVAGREPGWLQAWRGCLLPRLFPVSFPPPRSRAPDPQRSRDSQQGCCNKLLQSMKMWAFGGQEESPYWGRESANTLIFDFTASRILDLQLSLEWHGFKLLGSICIWIFFNRYIQKYVC